MFVKKLKKHLKILLAYRHRAFYAANEVAEISRLKSEGKNPYLEKTTAMLEGNNRVMRTRERKALSFKSRSTVKALYGLYTLYHNTVGTGYGSPYVLSGASIPSPKENIFSRFLIKKKSKKSESGTPIRLKERKYNQYITKEVNYLNSPLVNMVS